GGRGGQREEHDVGRRESVAIEWGHLLVPEVREGWEASGRVAGRHGGLEGHHWMAGQESYELLARVAGRTGDSGADRGRDDATLHVWDDGARIHGDAIMWSYEDG